MNTILVVVTAPGKRPASIPNLEAKPGSANGTATDRLWESRTPPQHTQKRERDGPLKRAVPLLSTTPKTTTTHNGVNNTSSFSSTVSIWVATPRLSSPKHSITCRAGTRLGVRTCGPGERSRAALRPQHWSSLTRAVSSRKRARSYGRPRASNAVPSMRITASSKPPRRAPH